MSKWLFGLSQIDYFLSPTTYVSIPIPPAGIDFIEEVLTSVHEAENSSRVRCLRHESYERLYKKRRHKIKKENANCRRTRPELLQSLQNT